MSTDQNLITTDPAQIRARLVKMAEDGTYVAADLTAIAQQIVVELAARFASQVCEYLTPDEVREAREENLKRIRSGDDTCATHDHCDANELMEAACQSMGFSLTDYPAEHPISQQRFDLANAAWTLARASNLDEAEIRTPVSVLSCIEDLDCATRASLLAFLKKSDRNGDFDGLSREDLHTLAVLDFAEARCPAFSRYDHKGEREQVRAARLALVDQSRREELMRMTGKQLLDLARRNGVELLRVPEGRSKDFVAGAIVRHESATGRRIS